MRNRVQRAARVRTGSMASDFAADREPGPRLSKQDGSSYARVRHLTTEEQARKAKRDRLARKNLAAMCFERVGIDLHRPVAEQEVPHRWTQLPTTAATVAGARDLLLLADMLGLGGVR